MRRDWTSPTLIVSSRLRIDIAGGKAYPGSEGELQVIRAEGVVLDANIDSLVQQIFVAVEVLSYAEPETEELASVSHATQ